ncbi:MAG TPA: transglutaminase family protein, partial [Candidatus Saccharimonadales bacterium]
MRNKKAKFLVLWLVGTLLISGLATPVRATAYSLRLVTTIDIGGVNEKAKVKQIFTVNGADKKALPAAAMIGVMGADLAGLTAKSEDGAKLSVNFLPEEQSIKVDLPKTKLKSTKPWSFTINYSAVVLSEFGAVKATQLPATTTNLDITSQTTTVLADLDLGFAVVRGHPVSKTGVGVGQQILTFTDKGPMSKSALIVFGDSTFVTVSQTTTLKNNSWWWKNLTLTLPPDTNQQMARLKSITPEPSNVRLDKDGNMVAEFRLGPLASRDVEVKTEVAVSGLSYSLENAVNIDQADPLLIERYTRLTDVWQPAGLEIAAAQDDTAADVVEKVFAAVVAEAAAGLDSTELLNVAARNASLELSDRLVGELRHRGVPAREALGLIMTDGNRLLAEPKPHAWVEAFVAGTGWITLDPWLGVLSGQFGGADPV